MTYFFQKKGEGLMLYFSALIPHCFLGQGRLPVTHGSICIKSLSAGIMKEIVTGITTFLLGFCLCLWKFLVR